MRGRGLGKVYSFASVAVTNYHKPRALKQQKLIRSQFRRLESKVKTWTWSAVSGGARKGASSWLLVVAMNFCCSLTCSCISPISGSVVIWPLFLCVFLCVLSSSYQDSNCGVRVVLLQGPGHAEPDLPCRGAGPSQDT